MKNPARQRGVALVIALLAVALALVLIASLLDRSELTHARTRNVVRGEQAAAYAEGLESFAAQVLMRDLDANPQLDTFGEPWSLPLPAQPVPGGQISARMRDLNGCFNLNNLLDDSRGVWRKRLRNLLTALQLDPALGGAIMDWLDSDANIDAEGGAEDAAYIAQVIAYRPGNRAFAHLSELRLVRGMDGDSYARLAAEACALPVGSSINLNTASRAVLMSLDSRMTAALADRIRQDGQARWGDVDSALREVAQQGVVIGDPDRIGLGVTSSYFLARGEILLDDVPFSFASLLERRSSGPDGGIHVIARSRGDEELASRQSAGIAGSASSD